MQKLQDLVSRLRETRAYLKEYTNNLFNSRESMPDSDPEKNYVPVIVDTLKASPRVFIETLRFGKFLWNLYCFPEYRDRLTEKFNGLIG